ncbi:MAG: hypothetical protein CMM93_03260 [Rickettsiales bacterium]|nr:hypothetical protein [Rickettsiales bacterium]|tara:strand:+ start:195 stop:599 length:405 start_codon:yes stop_codon:yes gene_type:complete
MTAARSIAYPTGMNRAFIALSLLLAATGCVTKKTFYQPHAYLEARDVMFPAVLPDSVAVLTAPPACRFLDIGTVSVAAPELEPSAKTVQALQDEAALHGADAIILHSNKPKNCENFVLCPGAGSYNFATAIKYN